MSKEQQSKMHRAHQKTTDKKCDVAAVSYLLNLASKSQESSQHDRTIDYNSLKGEEAPTIITGRDAVSIVG
jgi:hypothetical protein